MSENAPENSTPDVQVNVDVHKDSSPSEPVDATPSEDVPDSGLPTEGDSDDATVGDGEETHHEEDDDPASNVGERVE